MSLKRQSNFYGSRVEILSPAKINLYLNILGKYPGGFHRIESIVERVSLFDKITIEVSRRPRIEILSNEISIANKDNLCVCAAALLKEEFKLPFNFNIFLNKRIPIGAGLGGGSSNAASTLLGIAGLLNLKLTVPQLYKLGSKLGSDVNFFLSQSSFAFIYGRGEKVIPFSGKKLRHFIVWPKITLSTKKVYRKTRVKLTKFLCNVKILRYALNRGDIFLVKKNIFNVLEKSALGLCGQMDEVKQFFNNQEVFCRVTGSGSALYTISEKTHYKIDGLLPEKWLGFEVQTF